jgi:hypothetical protein
MILWFRDAIHLASSILISCYYFRASRRLIMTTISFYRHDSYECKTADSLKLSRYFESLISRHFGWCARYSSSASRTRIFIHTASPSSYILPASMLSTRTQLLHCSKFIFHASLFDHVTAGIHTQHRRWPHTVLICFYCLLRLRQGTGIALSLRFDEV